MIRILTAATAAPFTGRFFAAHSDKLKACGISEQSAIAAGIRSVTASDAGDVLGFGVPGDALEIAYRTLDGEDMLDDLQRPAVRFRVFDPRPDVPEEMRYLSRRDSGSRPYLPAGLAELLPTAKQLIFTEGEFKALSAVSSGLACAALAGVTMWAAPGRGLDRLSADTPVHPELVELASKVGRVVVLADSDARTNEAVEHAMRTFAEALASQAPGVLVVYKCCPKPSARGLKVKKMGLDDWIWAKSADDVESFVYRALRDEEQRLKAAAAPDAGFIPLGYANGAYHVFSLFRQQVDSLTPAEMSRQTQLMGTVGPEWADATYRIETDGRPMTDWNRLAGDIITGCTKAGLYRDDKVRGAGIWLDDGRLVVNGVDAWSPTDPTLTRITERHVYLKDHDLDMHPGTPAATDAEVGEVLAALRTFGFTRASDHRLTLGLVMLGFVCAALHWRPHAFIHGIGGAGKSHLLKFLDLLLGGAALCSQFRTPAGLRQKLRRNAITAICDETEADAETLGQFLEFFRLSAGGTEKSMGTADHKGVTFSARSLGILAGVKAPRLQTADQTRFIRMTLQPVSDAVKNAPHALVVKDSLASDLAARKIGGKLGARMLASWELFNATLEAVRQAMTGGRMSDVLAPVIAACYVAENSTPCTDVAAYVSTFDIADDMHRITSANEGDEFVDHLLSSAITIQLDGKRHDTTVGTAISEALIDSQVRSALGVYGLKPLIDNGVVMLRVAYKNPQLNGLFRGTRWEKSDLSGLMEMIKKIPGADRKTGDQRDRFTTGGATQAFLAMPLHDFEPPESLRGDPLAHARPSASVARAYGAGMSGECP